MEATGVAFQDDGWVVPYCHIMPVTCRKKILYFATDLHPNVLSTTTIGDDDEGAVMYIGPDSLALLDHWNSRQQPTSDSASIVDIGSGSGIQALSLSSILSDGTSLNVTSIDINSRALNLTKLNFEWNGFPMPKLVLGDITEPYGRSYETNEKLSWESIFGEPTIILANPPFLPVPVEDPIISKRYGLFSSGGASGDIILERIIRFASRTLSESSGTLAIVSEFINPESEFPEKFRQWWGYSNAQSVFFSNQEAMDADTYARRRADSSSEVDQWRDHLNQEGITDISPGLLFVKKQKSLSENNEINFSHYLVPKTEQGSIWTPTNLKAREFTKTILETTWGQILTTEGQ
jgi:tRNA1(Val) A37 N6-methylase TrmN6